MFIIKGIALCDMRLKKSPVKVFHYQIDSETTKMLNFTVSVVGDTTI